MLPVISHTSTVEELFSSRTFIAASVQRDYQWNASECDTLLSDLMRAWKAHTPEALPNLVEPGDDDDVDNDLGLLPTSSDHPPLSDYYLGAIVTRLTHDGVTEIYDGLQRITTLTILIAVLRDAISDLILQRRLNDLINLSPDKPRLMLLTRDWALRREVQQWGEAAKVRRNAPFSDFQTRVREAARTFRSTVNQWSEEERRSFTDFLLQRVAIVIVQASQGRLARQIFITTNLRGLPLNQADLFKGQVLDIAPDETTAAEMEKIWANVRLSVGDDLVPFLTAIDFITRRQEQSADCLQELVDHLLNKVGPENIKHWLRRLSIFASAWKHLEQKLETPGTTRLDADIWRLGLFKWQQWKPLALLWHANHLMKSAKGTSAASEAAYKRRFDNLHRRCMAITLAGLNQSQRAALFGLAIKQTVNKYNSLTGALLVTDAMRERIDDKMSTAFHDENRRITLLRWLESLSWDTPPPYIKQATIEHVLPQRPHPQSQWLLDFPHEADRLELCNNIGNFALVDLETNSLLDNADFAVKKPILCAAAPRFRLLHDFNSTTSWNRNDILQRTRALTQAIYEQLQIAQHRTNDASIRNGRHEATHILLSQG